MSVELERSIYKPKNDANIDNINEYDALVSKRNEPQELNTSKVPPITDGSGMSIRVVVARLHKLGGVIGFWCPPKRGLYGGCCRSLGTLRLKL